MEDMMVMYVEGGWWLFSVGLFRWQLPSWKNKCLPNRNSLLEFYVLFLYNGYINIRFSLRYI